jgi:hypothetical protein
MLKKFLCQKQICATDIGLYQSHIYRVEDVVELVLFTWWKYGGRVVVEVEKGGGGISLHQFFEKWRNGVYFPSTIFLPPRFSTTFFHHVKIGVAALLLLLFSFFTF